MSQADCVDLCHQRNVLRVAASSTVATATVPTQILETVDLDFRECGFALRYTRLEVIRALELDSDLEAIKAYAHQHLLSTPDSHVLIS
jgi:hypothetical protein